MPQGIDLRQAAQREPLQAPVVSKIAKHWFHGANPLAVTTPTFWRIEDAFHRLGGRVWAGLVLRGDRHLPHLGAIWIAQTPLSLSARQATAPAAALLVMRAPIDRATAAFAVEPLSCRTDARVRLRSLREVRRAIPLDFLRLAAGPLVVQRIAYGFVFALILEALIATTHLIVSNQRVDLVVLQCLQVRVAVIAGVGGDQCPFGAHLLDLLHQQHEHGLFGAVVAKGRIRSSAEVELCNSDRLTQKLTGTGSCKTAGRHHCLKNGETMTRVGVRV